MAKPSPKTPGRRLNNLVDHTYRNELDINTPRGQETVRQEIEAIAIFQKHFPELMYFHTPKDPEKKQDAKVDGVIVTTDVMIDAVVETKCRMMTTDQLIRWNYEWLITHAKLKHGRNLADMLCVPYYGFLYLVPEKKLLIQKIYDPIVGDFTVPYHHKNTRTQATVNGGSIIRDNAFVDMSKAEILE